ncbi:hypothetical protein F2P79_011774 [Pimephales promelas]|nr:hypothetical protein F2P79_011774 [Pimephales promelas]
MEDQVQEAVNLGIFAAQLCPEKENAIKNCRYQLLFGSPEAWMSVVDEVHLTYAAVNQTRSAQRSRHDTYNHLKGASPSQQQAEKDNRGEDVQRCSHLIMAPEFLIPSRRKHKSWRRFQFTCCQSRLLLKSKSVVPRPEHLQRRDEAQQERHLEAVPDLTATSSSH